MLTCFFIIVNIKKVTLSKLILRKIVKSFVKLFIEVHVSEKFYICEIICIKDKERL